MRYHLDEDGLYDPPKLQLGGITAVYDRQRNRLVMQIQDVLILPVGAQIELSEPNVTAVVQGVRLLAGSNTHPVQVCLDVEVPDAYWSEVETDDVRDLDAAQQLEEFTGL